MAITKSIKAQAVELQLFPNNPRFITPDEALALEESLGEYGSLDGIVVNTSPGRYQGAVISGNQKCNIIGLENIKPAIIERFEQPTISGTVAVGLVEFNNERWPYREVYWSDKKCEVANLRANNFGGHNDPTLLAMFTDDILSGAGINMQFEQEALALAKANFPDIAAMFEEAGKLQGDGSGADVDGAKQALSERFLAPPFTILDTRQGYWVKRKQYWRALIGDNGESREEGLSKGQNIMSDINSGVSILDPVLAECMVHWFGIPNGSFFDCFAGDTVFGYVSAYRGNTFTGIELRREQVELNNARCEGLPAKYICDDGQNVAKHIKAGSQDLLFSCPPYFDLEVYSELANDASNQAEYSDFLEILESAFSASIKCLKQDRFAVVVVGDIRDSAGFYRAFPDDIKRIFKKHGMPLYNELVLVESLGTLPQRVGRWMKNRKVGKCHQNVLVFYNGDPEQIAVNYPIIEIPEQQDESTDLAF